MTGVQTCALPIYRVSLSGAYQDVAANATFLVALGIYVAPNYIDSIQYNPTNTSTVSVGNSIVAGTGNAVTFARLPYYLSFIFSGGEQVFASSNQLSGTVQGFITTPNSTSLEIIRVL